MTDELEQTIGLTLKQSPWLMAEEWSIWLATGTYRGVNRGTFRDCLMVALPHYATGGHVLFKMIGTLDDIITPDEIAHATEYELVPVSPISNTEEQS